LLLAFGSTFKTGLKSIKKEIIERAMILPPGSLNTQQ
jgi:hypothetical protein